MYTPAVCETRKNYNRNYNKGLLVRANYVMPKLAIATSDGRQNVAVGLPTCFGGFIICAYTALRGMFNKLDNGFPLSFLFYYFPKITISETQITSLLSSYLSLIFMLIAFTCNSSVTATTLPP